ncbi:glycosyltransferase [Rhodobacteraceae bacterium 2CG4]|uniref:Glycosyltransferase n=1 Tax=Halovulum marinum TaxID=2662447 RepID=A0A6L5Z6P2_9RHOB|nr:glycosyltransferase [Halovulum marinum]MSU91724.1 glycosyltransferase [Halovulum marinum]
MESRTKPLRVVLWGTYDTGKPRVRLIRKALAAANIELVEIHADVWGDLEDKSQLTGLLPRMKRLLRWISAYPRLLRQYRRAPEHDAVIIGYLGHLDVQVIHRAARKRGVPIVWDAFLSLYDTVVLDRKLITPSHPAARLIRALEARACRCADKVVLDTEAQAALFRDFYQLPECRTGAVMIGAEPEMFRTTPYRRTDRKDRTKILFYGQFIPLHGIETIVRAAQLTKSRPIDWVIIGKGQEEPRIRKLIEADPPEALEWIPWVPYGELADRIRSADICLGVFGTTEKAGRVIPNKVFQILAAGAPLITRDGPAIRELLAPGMTGVRLVPPGDPEAIVRAIDELAASNERRAPEGARRRFELPNLGREWRTIVEELIRENEVASPTE